MVDGRGVGRCLKKDRAFWSWQFCLMCPGLLQPKHPIYVLITIRSLAIRCTCLWTLWAVSLQVTWFTTGPVSAVYRRSPSLVSSVGVYISVRDPLESWLSLPRRRRWKKPSRHHLRLALGRGRWSRIGCLLKSSIWSVSVFMPVISDETVDCSDFCSSVSDSFWTDAATVAICAASDNVSGDWVVTRLFDEDGKPRKNWLRVLESDLLKLRAVSCKI